MRKAAAMSVKTWEVTPLYVAIMDVLYKKKAMTDTDLLDNLKGRYEDLSFKELNKTLMKMEIGGLIFVTSLSKGKRRVELKERKE